MGEYEDAARIFGDLVFSYPQLADDHHFYRGQALYLWGSYLDAAEALAQVAPEGIHGPEARRLRAWALYYATDHRRLAAWLQEEGDKGPLGPELTYVWARARHRTGDVLGAFRGLRQVWRTAIQPELLAPSLVGLAKLHIGDKSLLDDAERKAVLLLESKLLQGPLEDRLGDLAKRLTGPQTGRLRAEVAFARGRMAAAAGRWVAAERHYADSESVAPVDALELRAQVGLALAGVRERLGRDAEALSTYQRVAERFLDRSEGESARLAASELLLRERRYADAQAHCEALLLANPVSPHRKRCLWNVGWGHYRQGQFARAREFFEALTKQELPAELAGASAYWLGRALLARGEDQQARSVFRSIVERYPLGYYSALAEDQVGTSTIVATKRVETGPLPSALQQALEYVRLGLKDRALQTGRAYERQIRQGSGRWPLGSLEALSQLYDQVGSSADTRRIREEGARILSPTDRGAFWLTAQRAHPLKFESEIRSAATEFGLEDALLFGLVRTESGFRSDAVSAVGALGLAQLMLPTARQVAQKLGARRVSRSRLLADPAFNVRLGAAYLRELLDRYQGRLPLALAAYNAGPNAVDAWMLRRLRPLQGVAGSGLGALPTADELAEEIPVAETRAFVKVVLARTRGYAHLYPKRTEIVPLYEPESEAIHEEPAEFALPANNVLWPPGIYSIEQYTPLPIPN